MRECVFPFLLEVSTKNSHAGVRALDPPAIAVAQFVQWHNPTSKFQEAHSFGVDKNQNPHDRSVVVRLGLNQYR